MFLVLLPLACVGKEYQEFLLCLILRLKQTVEQVSAIQNNVSLESLTQIYAP